MAVQVQHSRVHRAWGQMGKEGTRTVTSLASISGDQVDNGWDGGWEDVWDAGGGVHLEELGVEPHRTL